MPWKETHVTEERLRLVVLHETGAFTLTELCERFEVSRPTAYKWIERFAEAGPEGLEDRRRRAKGCRHRTPAGLEKEILEVREKHPRWGPIMIRAVLKRIRPTAPWPAASTIGEILKRNGKIAPRSPRRRARHPGRPYLVMKSPNDVWSADYKGEFKTRDGRWCYPLTIADGYSRFVIACRGGLSIEYQAARLVFEEAFREYGVPRQILTDNGTPFVSRGITGLTRLSVWFIELGIHPIRIQPGRPDQNGRHERMHRTLKQEIYPPAGNLSAQQRRFNEFRREFNEDRPHRSLDLVPPGEVYEPSPRRYPSQVAEMSYPLHYVVRTLNSDGGLSWRRKYRRISKALPGKRVGLEAVDEELYRVHFGPVLLGVFDAASGTFHA